MGNSPMTIGLKVDNGNGNRGIMAGSILYGRIYLSNKQVAEARSIRLKVIGTEETVVHHTTSEVRTADRFDDRSDTTDHYERHSHTIYNVDHTIKEFPSGHIPRGQFEFPFALQLPKSLPSSMEAQTGESYCRIEYKIIAEVFEKPNTLFFKNKYAEENLTVVAMPNNWEAAHNHDSSLHLPVEIVPMSSCDCCFFASCSKIGTMALEAKFDKTSLLMDEPTSQSAFKSRNKRKTYLHRSNDNSKNFRVQFRCENKTAEKVKSVKAELKEIIEWSARGHTKTIETILASSTMDASLFPELNAMWLKPFEWQYHKYNNETNRLLESKPWRTIEPPLGVDASMANDTYQGNAIQVRHVLAFKIISMGCFTTNPDASTLVQISRNPMAFGVERSEAHHDPLFCNSKPTHAAASASAPFEDEIFAKPATTAPFEAQSTAPSDVYDDNSYTGYKNDYTNSSNSESAVPMVEAQLVLPEDWNAQTEELVTIPIAEATAVSVPFGTSESGQAA